jgi:hypothetical protein
MKNLLITAAAALSLLGCAENPDPSEGGFFTGVQGLSSGSYDERIESREADVASAQARNEALAGQISAAERELSKAKFELLRQKQQATGMDAATAARIDKVLNTTPGGNDAAALAELESTIKAARDLSAELARLSG